MQDSTKYSYTIKIDELTETVRQAQGAGYPVTVIINGEYYTVDIRPDKVETKEA